MISRRGEGGGDSDIEPVKESVESGDGISSTHGEDMFAITLGWLA